MLDRITGLFDYCCVYNAKRKLEMYIRIAGIKDFSEIGKEARTGVMLNQRHINELGNSLQSLMR